MIQQAAVDVIVAAAAAWLVWTFAPFDLRRWAARLLPRGSRARAVAASPVAAGGVEGLQARELDGRSAPTQVQSQAQAAKDCGPGCGCGCG